MPEGDATVVKKWPVRLLNRTGHSEASSAILVQHRIEVFFDLADGLDVKLVRTGIGETFDLHRRLD